MEVSGEESRESGSNSTSLIKAKATASVRSYSMFPCKLCQESFEEYDDFLCHQQGHTTCSVCRLSLPNVSTLVQHVTEKHQPCPVCGERSTDSRSFVRQKHFSTHDSFVCLICRKSFPNIHDLQVHWVSHSECKCHMCNTVLPNKHHFVQHLKKCHFNPMKTQSENTVTFAHLQMSDTFGDKTCPHCFEKLRGELNMENIKDHFYTCYSLKGKIIFCEPCDVKLSDISAYLEHAKSHNCCNFCSYMGSDVLDLHSHISDVHPMCLVCGTSFADKFTLNKHLAQHIVKECFWCAQVWRNYETLKVHVAFHPHRKCYFCGDLLETQTHLETHLKQEHTVVMFTQNQEAFSSENCSSSSSSPLSAQPTVPALCDVIDPKQTTKRCKCGANISDEQSYNRHLRSHFVCDICGMKETGAETLHKHIRKNHPMCVICGATNRTKCSLQSHYKIHKTLSCYWCAGKFDDLPVLMIHANTHQVEKCCICEVILQDGSSLSLHLRQFHEPDAGKSQVTSGDEDGSCIILDDNKDDDDTTQIKIKPTEMGMQVSDIPDQDNTVTDENDLVTDHAREQKVLCEEERGLENIFTPENGITEEDVNKSRAATCNWCTVCLRLFDSMEDFRNHFSMHFKCQLCHKIFEDYKSRSIHMKKMHNPPYKFSQKIKNIMSTYSFHVQQGEADRCNWWDAESIKQICPMTAAVKLKKLVILHCMKCKSVFRSKYKYLVHLKKQHNILQ